MDVLLIGAGDLGTQVGLGFCDRGDRVTAVRRNANVLPTTFHAVSADVRQGLPAAEAMPAMASAGPDVLVITLTAGARDEDAYRATFLDAVAAVLRDVRERGWAPRRALFVSSTAVCAPAGFVDEATPAAPASATGEILHQAEQNFLAGLPGETRGIVVRPSGIYGPGREWMIGQVRAGQVRNGTRMTHRIHRDDLARSIIHLLTMGADPDELYLITDDEPALADDVAAFIADLIQVPWEHISEPSTDTRRLSNARLRATGVTLRYPTYREGYAALLATGGQRHP